MVNKIFNGGICVMARVDIGSILLVNEDNPFHDWIIFDLARRKGLPIRKVEVTESKLRKLKYMRIIDKTEIIQLEGSKQDVLKEIKNIKNINRNRRILVVPIKDKQVRKTVESVFKNDSLISFPPLKDYKEKEKVVTKVISRWELECETVEVRKTLIRNMIRDVSTWENVLLLWETLQYRGEVLKKSDIDELFPDNEFYNLDRFIFKVLEGKVKRKTIKMAYYFLEVRDYSPSWVRKRIQDEVYMFGLVYQAFRGGVLLIPDNKRRLTERITELGWNDGLPLGELKEHEQRKYLQNIEKIPYRYFLSILPIIYNVPEYTHSEDIYRLIENLRHARRNYEDGK